MLAMHASVADAEARRKSSPNSIRRRAAGPPSARLAQQQGRKRQSLAVGNARHERRPEMALEGGDGEARILVEDTGGGAFIADGGEILLDFGHLHRAADVEPRMFGPDADPRGGQARPGELLAGIDLPLWRHVGMAEHAPRRNGVAL